MKIWGRKDSNETQSEEKRGSSEMSEYFSGYTCPADYEEAGLIPIEPMTAKEIIDKDRKVVMTSHKFFSI